MLENASVMVCLVLLSVVLTGCPPGGPESYSVTYQHSNTTGALPTDPNTYETGDTVTVLDSSGLTADAGYTILPGWNTEPPRKVVRPPLPTLCNKYTLSRPLRKGNQDPDVKELHAESHGICRWFTFSPARGHGPISCRSRRASGKRASYH